MTDWPLRPEAILTPTRRRRSRRRLPTLIAMALMLIGAAVALAIPINTYLL